MVCILDAEDLNAVTPDMALEELNEPEAGIALEGMTVLIRLS